MQHVAIVGGSLAGISTARALRAQGYAGRLTVIGAEAHRPYDRPPLSKEFLTGAVDEPSLSLEMPGEDLAIDWRLGAAATRLDPERLVVTLDNGDEVSADGVVIGTGAAALPLAASLAAVAAERADDAQRPPLSGVHLLRTIDEARSLRAGLAAGGRLVVVGGGFIGCEVASTARQLGLDVTLAHSGALPLVAQLGPEMARVVADLHLAAGTRLESGVRVAGLHGTDRIESVRLADGRRLPADLVVVGVGARPATRWLTDSGLTLDEGTGAVQCDTVGATERPGVVAVGDCAAWWDDAAGRPVLLEHWTPAHERGPIAAATLLGHEPPRLRGGRAPYFWSDQCGVKIQFAGHTELGDEVLVEEGSPAEGSLLAVYRRAGEPVAVLGIDRPRPFTQWRRQLGAVPA